MTPSSYLFVPGDAPDKLAKAGRTGAGALILDLEDAVAPSQKAVARENVAKAVGDGSDRPQTWVRVNQEPLLADDIAAVAGPGIAGIVLPKAEPELLAAADSLLAEAERRLGLPDRTLAVIALVETARGVLSAATLASHPRVVRLGIGEADLIGELGLRPGPERAEMAPIRLDLVLASSAAGLAAPIGPVETALADLELLRATTTALLGLGFRARTALHPRQLPVINDVFTPSAAEVAKARRIVAALDAAEASGSGVAVDENQQFIDLAVVRSAREILLRHNGSV